MPAAPLTLLDGAMGTELGARGLRLDPPRWSAHALIDAPDVISAVHAAYTEAGATVHTANTFRTTATAWGPGWQRAAAAAIALARASVPAGHRVAASLAPVADCYSPEASPAEADVLHAALAEALASPLHRARRQPLHEVPLQREEQRHHRQATPAPRPPRSGPTRCRSRRRSAAAPRAA
jgi:hypothetical protein